MTQIESTISPRTNAHSESDADLLQAFADRRDERAFAEVVRRHGGMVLSVCRSVLGNTTDAEDAAQAVFITLARKAGSTTVRGRVVGWLHRVAWYVAKRGAATRSIRQRHEQEAARMVSEKQLEARQQSAGAVSIEDLHASLEGLSEKYKVAMILHHLEGKSHEETAKLVGCSVETVAVRLHRGREMVREKLRKRGVVASLAALAGMWGIEEVRSVSAEFAENTASAAGGSISGGATAAGISGAAASMANDALQMLVWEKIKNLGVISGFALGVVLVAFGLIGPWLNRPADQAGPAMVAVATKPAAVTSAKAQKTVTGLPGNPVTGVIEEVADGSIVLRRRIGPLVRIAVDDATVVKVDEAAATLPQLKVGMSVASFAEEGKPAMEIWARTDKGAPQ